MLREPFPGEEYHPRRWKEADQEEDHFFGMVLTEQRH